jgi:pimeloyl-ACP methyl ester carboxylesterase
MAYADANGQKIFYVDSGGEGPPVVFSHGFAMDHSMFDAQVAALTPDFRCITWDQRAHGLTDDDGRPFDYWDSARDLLGLLDHLGLTSAALVGMSQGAFLSMRAALEAPDRVKALVIISSRAGLDPQEVYDGFAGLRAEWTANGPANVRQNVADMLIGDPAYYPGWFAKWDQQDRARSGRPSTRSSDGTTSPTGWAASAPLPWSSTATRTRPSRSRPVGSSPPSWGTSSSSSRYPAPGTPRT